MESTQSFKPLPELVSAVAAKDLRPNPQYQRGAKWTVAQKRSLIDSLLRGYRIPLIYIHIRERTNAFGKTTRNTSSSMGSSG